MKPYFYAILVGVLSACFAAAHAQVVFSDNFDRTTLSPGGTPSVTYSLFLSIAGFTGAQIGGTDATTATSFTLDQLVTWSDGSSPAYSRSRVAAPLTGYLAPFNRQLNLNTGDVCWTFNVRTSSPETGSYGTTDNFTTLVLVSTDNTLYASGTGYGVTFSSGPALGMQFVRFNGGMGGTVTPLITPAVSMLAAATDYTSVMVIYTPATNNWRLYVRDDGASAFADPSSGVNNLIGCTVDSTYTRTAMGYFGYMSYYDEPVSGALKYSYYDNYTVSIIPSAPAISPIFGTDSICLGTTTTLGDAITTGTWTSGTPSVATIGATTGVVSGLTTGSSIITCSFGSGCAVYDTVTVFPLPSVITGPSSVCAGSTVSLVDSVSSGKWSSSDTLIGKIDSLTGVVIGISPGSITITYKLPTGCFMVFPMTVNATPSAISGGDSVCVGSSITLTDGLAGGSWSSSNNLIATIGGATGTLSGIAPGVDTITYTMATGCLIMRTETVNPLPGTITAPSFAVCSGLSITLSDTPPGGTWSSGAGTIASVTAAGGVVTGGLAGTANISYTLSTGCFSVASVTVNPLPAIIGGPTSVCFGQSITATDVTPGGTWAVNPVTIASIGASTGIINGTLAGSAVVTYTLGTGCEVTEDINVDALPVPITGPSSLCVGSTVTLNDLSSGGTWSSSNATVATVVAGPGGSGIVMGASAGTAIITYTIGTGCFVTQSMTINPLPAAISGPLDVCASDGIVTLSDLIGGGTWSSATPTVATIGSATGIVTGIVPGTTTIDYTLSTTGCYVSAIVTIHPLPVSIDGDSLLCVGTTMSLTGVAPGGIWTSGSTSVASIGSSSGIVTGLASGTALITYTVAYNCYITRPVTVNALPAASVVALGDTIMCPGDFVILLANTGTGISYQWFNNGIAIPAAVTSDLTLYNTGLYSVFETNAAGCTALSTPMHVLADTPVASIMPPASDTFCLGGMLTLYANTGAGLSYQWLSNGVTISGAVNSFFNATTAGEYAVDVIAASGCWATDSIRLYTRASPTPTITIYGSLAFCAGDSVVLMGSSGLNYQWNYLGAPIPGATNGLYVAANAGSYSLTQSNALGCSGTSASVTVTVNPAPVTNITVTGSATFCTGGSVLLSVPFSTSCTYQWYNSGVAIPGANSSAYAAISSGSYGVFVTNTLTGCSGLTLVPVVVTLVDSPYVIGVTSSSFCWGSHVTLAVNLYSTTGISFQWYLGGLPIPGANGSTLVTDTPGNYTCMLSVGTSCTIMAAALTVNEFPLPNPTVAWVAPNLVTQNDYVTYQWYRDLIMLPGANAYIYTPSDTGRYSVLVTDTNGCQSESDQFVLTDSLFHVTGGGGGGTGGGGTGGSNYVAPYTYTSATAIEVYPNPACNLIHIDASIKLKALLVAIDGRRLMEVPDAKTIDISELPSGTYLLLLYGPDGLLLRAEKMVKAN